MIILVLFLILSIQKLWQLLGSDNLKFVKKTKVFNQKLEVYKIWGLYNNFYEMSKDYK